MIPEQVVWGVNDAEKAIKAIGEDGCNCLFEEIARLCIALDEARKIIAPLARMERRGIEYTIINNRLLYAADAWLEKYGDEK